MNRHLYILVLCSSILTFLSILIVADEEKNDEYVLSTNELPTDDRYLCYVGNGHLATNVFTDTVFMNGLYNGIRGESHRARIPAWSNIRILNSTLEQATGKLPTYSINTFLGYFALNFETQKAFVEHRLYVHRFYTRAIVNQIVVSVKDGGNAPIDLGLFQGPDSEDIRFQDVENLQIAGRNVSSRCGETLVVEDARYQAEPSKICVYWTTVPSQIIAPNDTTTIYTFVMTVDNSSDVAKKEMEDVLGRSGDDLFENHIDLWSRVISGGNVVIHGNKELAKVVYAAQYYIYSSLSIAMSNQPSNPFYGLSPGGLSRGSYLRDYQGHSFWDTETWMYPSVLLLHPGAARRILEYRINNMKAAGDLALVSNHKGIRFPWESAFTGTEVTPDCCPEVVEYQHHITGCIAFAARQYIAVTGNDSWLEGGGCEFIKKMGEFWASRVEYNDETKFYDIKNVMGPDEDHHNVNNSVFTNVIAGMALYFGDYAACLCNDTTVHEPSWSEIARKLTLLYDEELDYHPQYEGYERPTMIKQADVVLLGFPLMYQMNDSTKANNLAYYENVTRDNGPAMTWSMHTIGHLQIGDNYEAAKMFNRSYQRYIREPFYIWTEAIEPEIGAVNFITGMGGFFQSILFGYGGITIHLDRIEINKPQLMENVDGFDINAFKYLGGQFTIQVRRSATTFRVVRANRDIPLILLRGNDTIPILDGISVILSPISPNILRRAVKDVCPVPLDLIGQSD